MTIKNLVNYSEYRTMRMLDSSLRMSSFRVMVKVRLVDVLGFDESMKLSSEEKNFLRTSHFDFLVCSANEIKPQFAVEFDGPYHFDQKQVVRDATKNRLCSLAGLPILRIGDLHLRKHAKASLIEYMISRFIAWHSEDHDEDFPDYQFMFNLRHPFPGFAELVGELFAKHGITSIYLKEEERQKTNHAGATLHAWVSLAEESFPEGSVVVKYNFGVCRLKAKGAAKSFVASMPSNEEAEILFSKNLSYRMGWAISIQPDYDPSKIPADYFARTGKIPIMFQGIAGVHMPAIAENLGEFLCLSEIQKWADKQGSPNQAL